MEDLSDFWFLCFLGYVVNVAAAWAVGSSRGRGEAGLLCGLVLPGIGMVVALFLPKEGLALEERKPGAPVKRARAEYKKPDPIEEFEAREQARRAFEEGPVHLRGKVREPVVVPLRRAKMKEDE